MSLEFSIARTAQALGTPIVDRDLYIVVEKFREAERRLRVLEAEAWHDLILTAAVQEATIPVTDPEALPWLTVCAHLMCTTTSDISVKVNGSTTNVAMVYHLAFAGADSVGTGLITNGNTSGVQIWFCMDLRQGAHRKGQSRSIVRVGTDALFDASIVYADATTPITSIAFRSNTASDILTTSRIEYCQSARPGVFA